MSARWFYSRDGRQMVGRCTAEELKRLAAAGQLLPTDSVRRGEPRDR